MSCNSLPAKLPYTLVLWFGSPTPACLLPNAAAPRLTLRRLQLPSSLLPFRAATPWSSSRAAAAAPLCLCWRCLRPACCCTPGAGWGCRSWHQAWRRAGGDARVWLSLLPWHSTTASRYVPSCAILHTTGVCRISRQGRVLTVQHGGSPAARVNLCKERWLTLLLLLLLLAGHNGQELRPCSMISAHSSCSSCSSSSSSIQSPRSSRPHTAARLRGAARQYSTAMPSPGSALCYTPHASLLSSSWHVQQAASQRHRDSRALEQPPLAKISSLYCSWYPRGRSSGGPGSLQRRASFTSCQLGSNSCFDMLC
jgi:hypothetical protein